MRIRSEEAGDVGAIRGVNVLAFGQETEARLIDALRAGGFVEAQMSLVALENERLVGHVLFSRLEAEVDDRAIRAAALAPLAVHPEFQRKGIGSALARDGLARLTARGYDAIFVLGDPRYYKRLGFTTELARPIASPYAGEHFMAIELVAGSLTGVSRGSVAYPAPFAAL